MKALSEQLSTVAVKAIYTSPLERAVETAGILAEAHSLTPIVREELGEVHFGRWDGMTFSQLSDSPEWRRFNMVRSLVRPPGGELMTEVQSRMVSILETLRERHQGEILAVVSHGDPIRAVVAHYLGCCIDMLTRFEIKTASLTAIRFVEDVPTILCLNSSDASAL